MSFFNSLIAKSTMLVNRLAEDVFGIELEQYQTSTVVDKCLKAYHGDPEWQWSEEGIYTINFTKTVCEELAKLATMNIEIHVDGSPRAEWLDKQLHLQDRSYRRWVELGCAAGTMILKPNGQTIDMYLPGQFFISNTDGDEITGVVFINSLKDGDNYYTRFEWHRREGDRYTIRNRVFVGTGPNSIDTEVALDNSPWSDLEEEVVAENVEHNLFGTFVMPNVNNEDLESPLGLPVVSNCLVEMEGLDNAFSLYKHEIDVSSRTVLLDSDRLLADPGTNKADPLQAAAVVKKWGLPDYVKLVDGVASVESEIYHEINPSLNTETRLQGINAYLSQIGFKCGFSNGYFVFNEKTGMVTATQVESDDRRTIQTINDIRKQLRACMDELAYALNVFADAYGLAPSGEYEIAYDFQDITLNEDEDRARWLSFVNSGYIPFWRYLVMFEGYTENEAKEIAIQEEPTQETIPSLFGSLG